MLPATALAAVGLWASYVNVWRPDRANPILDELAYQLYGWLYIHGNYGANAEHPPLAKYLYGLAQLIVGYGLDTTRLVAGVAAMLTGAVAFRFARHAAGFWAGLLAAAVTTLAPLDVVGAAGRFTRFGMLEPFLVLFATAALYAGWRWAQTGRWALAVAAGTLLGLATASKFTAVCFLPTVVLGAVVVRRTWHALVQSVACGLAAVSAFAACYLPQGAAGWHSFRYLLAFNFHHSDIGHLVAVAGQVYLHPPWWAQLWWQTQSYGIPLTVLLAGGALAGLVAGPRPLCGYLLSGYLVPLAIVGLSLGFGLPFYYVAWQSPLWIAAAIGVATTARRLRQRLPTAPGAVLVAVGAPLLLAFPAGRTTLDVHRAHRTGYGRLIEILRTDKVTSPASSRPVALLDPHAALESWEIRSVNETAPPGRSISFLLSPPAAPDGLRAVVVDRTAQNAPTRSLVRQLRSRADWQALDAGDGTVVWLRSPAVRGR